MENNEHDIKEDKRIKRNLIYVVVFVFLFAALAYGSLIWAIVEDKKDLAETNLKLQSEQQQNSNCSYTKDSLYKEVVSLSIYKPLTKAMVHRDEATSLLKYKVGDFVIMKADSSRAVISDIISGGSKFEYYVKYRVLYKDKTTEEVIPELVY